MFQRNYQRHCGVCDRLTRHVRTSGDQLPATAVFMLLTLMTCGLGFPLAVVVAFWMMPKPRCKDCGNQS